MFINGIDQKVNLAPYRKKIQEKAAKQISEANLNVNLEDKIEGLNQKEYTKEPDLIDENGKPKQCTFAKTRKNFTQ